MTISQAAPNCDLPNAPKCSTLPPSHDGSTRTLAAVVDHDTRALRLRLRTEDKRNLVEYLKSL
jgi:hypothetical protein